MTDIEKTETPANPEQTTASIPPARQRRSWIFHFLCVLVLLLLCCGLLLTWVVKTESGSRSLFALIDYVSLGSLKANGIRGSIGDDIQIDELLLKTPTLEIKASGVQLSWHPAALWHKQVLVDRLQASSLLVATASSNTPASLPTDLGLPFALQARELALGRLVVADILAGGKQKEVVTLTALKGSLQFVAQQYRAQLALSSPWGNANVTSATMAGQRPFALKGNALLQGQVRADVPPVAAQLQVAGSLQELQLALQAQLQEKLITPAVSAEVEKKPVADKKTAHLNGTASALIAPFDAQIFKSAHVDIQHFNPAAWASAAPEADLRLLADLRPKSEQNAQQKVAQKTQQKAPQNTEKNITKSTAKNIIQPASANYVEGEISVTNVASGPLNRNAIPLRSVSASLNWQATHLDFSNLVVQVESKGQIRGDASLDLQGTATRAHAQLSLTNIDLNQIDQRLHTTHINGSAQVQTAANQTILTQAQLNDGKARLNAELTYDLNKVLLSLSKFELQAEDSRLDAKGEIAFSGNQVFHFKGNLSNFDPARWMTTPAGRLQAEFSTDGQLQPRLQLQAKLPALHGQYAGQAVQGNVDLQWRQDQQLMLRQLDLRWGKNVLKGQGAWGAVGDVLTLNLDAPELSELNTLFGSGSLAFGGKLKADVQLQGRFNDMAGSLTTEAEQFSFSQNNKTYTVAKLSGKLSLSKGLDGQIDGDISAQQLGGDFPVLNDADLSSAVQKEKIRQLHVQLKGKKAAHTLQAEVAFSSKQQLNLAADGALSVGAKNDLSHWEWKGQLQSLALTGKPDLRLVSPASLQITPDSLRLGSLQLQSEMAKLTLDQFEWLPGTLTTKGSMSDVRLLDVVNLFRPQYTVTGNLKLNAKWDLQLKDSVRGDIRIERQSGDLRFNDPDGTGTPVPLGIRNVLMQLRMGGLVAGTDGERMQLTATADGARLGQWQVNADSFLSKQDGRWTILSGAGLNGRIKALIPDLEWLGPLINPGVVLKGKLNVDGMLMGTIGKPRYRADVSGRELELAFASEGLLLPNGILEAHVEDDRLTLSQLQFSNTVTMLPPHAQFKGVDMLGKRGEFNASGEIDIGKETGSIQAQWQQFPMLQRKDRWLVVSGQASIIESKNIWSLTGKVMADGAYFKLPKMPPPGLSSDVHVTRKSDKRETRTADAVPVKKGLKTRVDVSFDMGPRFVFVGRGLDTGLAGSLRMRSIDGSPLQATGTINTVRGVYEGYGQQLAIERGILNFQGPPANPGLNIRALRQGLAVEAGVEVVGSVAAPQVRLVSEPAVPDAEKLSWLVLGRGSDQLAGGDASLLMSAATAIFGGDGSRNIPRDIVQGLGFDEFSIGASGQNSSSHVPVQTVAGATGTSSSSGSDKVVSVGKRLMPGLVLSVERGLGDASGAIRLSWQLTRRITVIGRAGNESAVDVTYTFSFN
ncbi:translocation/assembly module TamB domain-containing protein [Undibacterium sp. 14-3-2]|uniref:translocation/assembly module TamB domain-containing protein n=1 Tax=Undibacterium sp. 14-3-2 TaxID=2800129 RepID=UPI001905EF86|nr:translocation/assembly module TamB domain-containing protein [Undibacterium sp. 14-3-2]MBK1890498.1 translocation/assembly module TamB domain-containing protein [Undibacterium sp. 14-3-2]